MKLLVSGASATVDRLAGEPIARHHLGRLYRPGNGNKIKTDLPWAIDNGAFTSFDAGAFRALLDKAACQPNCMWVACPDVVGDWQQTVNQFWDWFAEIRDRQLNVAIVAQDGATPQGVPWAWIDALFIGGTTEWKESPTAFELGSVAMRHRKLVHVGRVNSMRRLRPWFGTADSFDGGQFSMFPDTYVPRWLKWLRGCASQQSIEFPDDLFEEVAP